MYAILTAIIIILGFILFAPLRLKVSFTDKGAVLKVFLCRIPVFTKKAAKKKEKHVEEDALKKAERTTKEAESLSRRIARFVDLFKTAVRLLRKYVGIENISLDVKLGTNDAALTAVSVGALWAAIYGVIGAVGSICYIKNQNVAVTPDYVQSGFSLDGTCIIKSRFAYIIFIAITILKKIKSRKGKEE